MNAYVVCCHQWHAILSLFSLVVFCGAFTLHCDGIMILRRQVVSSNRCSVDRSLALLGGVDIWQLFIVRRCVNRGRHAVVLWCKRLLLGQSDLLSGLVSVGAGHRLSCLIFSRELVRMGVSCLVRAGAHIRHALVQTIEINGVDGVGASTWVDLLF